MPEAVDHRPDRELALNMKCRLKFAGREQEPVDAPQVPPKDIDKEARAAFAAGDAGIALECPRHRIAADDLDGVGGIDGFGRIGPAMHGLAIVAMAEELHDRLGDDLDLHRTAAALDLGHWFWLPFASCLAASCSRGSLTQRLPRGADIG